MGSPRCRADSLPEYLREYFGALVIGCAVLPALAMALSAGVETLELDEMHACVAQLPECLEQIGVPAQEEERVALQLLQTWMQGLSAQDANWDADGRTGGELRHAALGKLLDLANSATSRPALALGIGQVLYSYFFWGLAGQMDGGTWPQGLSVEVLSVALELHEVSLRQAFCDTPETSVDAFLIMKCPWRWRFVMLLGTELGLHLAIREQDFAKASSLLLRTANHFSALKSLPFFQGQLLAGPMRLNQNLDYFPDARHLPVLPREVWPSFGNFLEEHYKTFRVSLEALLAADPRGEFFADAARHQSGLTPRHLDWARLKLIHSGGASELCGLPFMRSSCELLAARPEIGPRCGAFLSGASLVRLLPGAELKPHFGTHPRLTAHLGLRAPGGSSMTVAGEEVFWHEGRAVVFDDSYFHHVRNRGDEPRYLLVAWFCHPCDLGWRRELDLSWRAKNPLPLWCGSGGGGYSNPPVPGYGDSF